MFVCFVMREELPANFMTNPSLIIRKTRKTTVGVCDHVISQRQTRTLSTATSVFRNTGTSAAVRISASACQQTDRQTDRQKNNEREMKIWHYVPSN
jgi:hypothetical protein